MVSIKCWQCIFLLYNPVFWYSRNTIFVAFLNTTRLWVLHNMNCHSPLASHMLKIAVFWCHDIFYSVEWCKMSSQSHTLKNKKTSAIAKECVIDAFRRWQLVYRLSLVHWSLTLCLSLGSWILFVTVYFIYLFFVIHFYLQSVGAQIV